MRVNIQEKDIKFSGCPKEGLGKSVRYKKYDQDVHINISVLAKDLVSENVLLQIINTLVEQLDTQDLDKYYSGKGCPPYHPKMLLKVWLYGYCTKVYTSRPLAQKLREDIGYIWLSGGQRPCFKTLSSFRSGKLKDIIDLVFTELLVYLVEQGYINLSDLYLDGSKWEANNNKHKITWSKNTARYKSWVLARVKSLLSELEDLQAQEDQTYGRKDLALYKSSEEVVLVLKSEDLQAQVKHLQDLVSEQSDKQVAKRIKQLSNQLSKEQINLAKYEHQEVLLAGRNSYGKTDTDSTGMRMKDDSLKAGYNPQITTSNQYIINSTVHQNGSDSPTLPRHIEALEKKLEALDEKTDQFNYEEWEQGQKDYTADAGYGSEQNFDLLEQKEFTAYVKYRTWYIEHTGKIAKYPFKKENWLYDKEQDYYLCPAQKKLVFIGTEEVFTKNGYPKTIRKYQCQSCLDCPLFKSCRGEKADPKSNRKIQISPNLEKHKNKAKERLASDKGVEKRKNRSTDVETPFGNIKFNMAHPRFILRGLQKVNIEFTLLAMAHNLRKIFCQITGCWEKYYAQRAAKSINKNKRAKN